MYDHPWTEERTRMQARLRAWKYSNPQIVQHFRLLWAASVHLAKSRGMADEFELEHATTWAQSEPIPSITTVIGGPS